MSMMLLFFYPTNRHMALNLVPLGVIHNNPILYASTYQSLQCRGPG